MTINEDSPQQRPVLAVGAVVWNERDEILLIRRGQEPRLGQWSIPGGRVEWGETVLEAVVREVREETGLDVEIAGMIEVVDSVRRDKTGVITHHYVLIDFAARAISGELRAASDASDARFVPLAGLDDYGLWSETRRIIEASATLVRR